MAVVEIRKAKARYGKRRYIRRPRKMRGSSVSTAVRKYVKRAVHGNVENKCVQINAGYSFGNVTESPDLNAYPMCPLNTFWSISLGTGQGARIGNQIKTRKVMLNYILRPTSYDATTNPIPQPSIVQLMLGYVKLTPGTLPVAADVNNLFQSGSGVSPPNGSLRDIISAVNNDYWVIKKRWSHKIGYAENSATGASGSDAYFANNDYKYSAIKRLDITKFIPKVIQFNDSSTTTLTKNLFFMVQAVSAAGGIYGSNRLPVNIEFWIDFHYEDA